MRIDLRSDTVTKPTPGMLEAMRSAKVGDDLFGEDDTVNALQARVAELLGFEAALFVPSGTMANQLAMAAQCEAGDSVIAEQGSHIFHFEAAGAAALSGLQIELIPQADRLADDALRLAYRAGDLNQPATKLLVVENTHNLAGGRVLAVDELARILCTAHGLGVKAHCDGARLWNAAAALGIDERALICPAGHAFASAAVCFSKGLGAPVGSALCGTRAMIERARRLRKRWGGAMRQAGYLAACALYAVDHHRQALSRDHQHAAQLAMLLREARQGGLPIETVYPEPGTNLLYVRMASDPRLVEPAAQRARAQASGDTLVRRLRVDDVWVLAMGQGWVRLVTHRDVDSAAIERAGALLLKALRAEHEAR